MEDFFCFLKNNAEVIGLVINGLTFVAGLYALCLFYRRNVSFEKQVVTGQEQVKVSQKQAETSEKNLFNDRLSRAIEAIGHKSLAVRHSGLRLIHNLVKEDLQNSDDREMVIKILHDYIRARAILPKKDENDALPEPKASEKRADIVLGIELLSDLVPPADRDEVMLDSLDFRNLIFNPQQDLRNVYLGFANLEYAILFGANLQGAVLLGANLKRAVLWLADLKGAAMRGADISNAKFIHVTNLTQKQLNACVYEVDKPPRSLPEGLEVHKDRAYKWEDLEGQMCRRFFDGVEYGDWIDSTTPWWYEGDEDENENEET